MVKKRSIWPYLLVAPAVFIILCVVFVPVANAIIMSFQNYDLRRPKDIAFNGVANYIEALGDSKFQSSFFKTIIWVVAGVGFQFLFGFILAILLNQEFKGRGAIRAISMIPWVTPGVLIGLMWRWIYDGNQGVLNDILMKLHLISDKVPFLSQDGTAFPSVILTIIWQGIPFFALMLLAALQGVSTDMYEAADIDGATAIQKLAYITIPSIKNTIFVTALFVISIIAVLYWFFGTELGCSIRATGCNANMSRAQGINTDVNKILGLMLSNGIVALASGLYTQYQGFADINAGRGAIVIGLAAVIIGQVVFGKIRGNFAFKLLSVAFGAIIYYLVLQVVLWLGLNSNDLKLLSAIVVAVFLAIPYLKGKYFARPVKRGGASHA